MYCSLRGIDEEQYVADQQSTLFLLEGTRKIARWIKDVRETARVTVAQDAQDAKAGNGR